MGVVRQVLSEKTAAVSFEYLMISPDISSAICSVRNSISSMSSIGVADMRKIGNGAGSASCCSFSGSCGYLLIISASLCAVQLLWMYLN